MAAKRSAAKNNPDVLGQVRGRAAEVSELVKSGARAAKEQAAERISTATRTLKDEAARVATDQKDWAATEIKSVGGAIHEAARKLHDNDLDAIAEYVNAAAERVQNVAHYLEDHELAELVEPVAGVVRRHPAAFIGGFLAAGILLGRFIKAGQPPPVPKQDSRSKDGRSTSRKRKKSRR